MNPIAMFIGLVMLAASVFFVASPLRATALQKKSSGRRDALKDTVKASPEKQRQAVLLALRDLDFDYQAAKVAEEDYQTLRANLLTEAAQLMERQEREEDDSIEALIQSRKRGPSSAQPASTGKANGNTAAKAASTDRLCQHCQAPLAEEAKFCSKCGSPVTEVTCQNCKKPLQPGDQFCPACGMAVHVEEVKRV